MNIKEAVILNAEIGDPKKWKPFEFNYDGSTLDEAIDRLDTIITDSMYTLQDTFQGVTFGLGLSGGLDSRIVLHYAKKVGIDVHCFIYGDPYPHYPFASRDYKNALLIAKKYGIKDITVLQPGDIRHNFIADCCWYPIKVTSPMDMLFTREYGLLLSGYIGGESMGSCIPPTPTTDPTQHIFRRLSTLTPIAGGPLYTHIPGIITEREFNEMYDKIDATLYRYSDYITAIYTYLYSHLFLCNHGPPGIMHKQRNITFSPFYTKQYIAEMKSWNPAWIANHTLQRAFHMKVVPELCGITNQRWMVPFKYQHTWISHPYKYLLKGAFALRWHGLQYHTWLYDFLHSDFAKHVLLNEIDFPFDGKAVLQLPKHLSVLGYNILKAKYVAMAQKY